MKYILIKLVLLFTYCLMLIFKDKIPFGLINEKLLVNDYLLIILLIGILNLAICYKKNSFSKITIVCIFLFILLIVFMLKSSYLFQTI